MTSLETGDRSVQGRSAVPAAPAQESAGPPLTDLVMDLRQSAALMQSLFRQARMDAITRTVHIRGSVALDSNGDGALKLYEVPQGALGCLAILNVDIMDATVTPAAPVTSADLWLAIYSGPAGSGTAAQVAQDGAMLDCQPSRPGTDAQIPTTFTYGSIDVAPCLPGPEAFWLVVDGATASETIAVRGRAIVFQPEA